MRADIRIYKDAECTKELEKNLSNEYVFEVDFPASVDMRYTKIFYVKNIGGHKAYNITPVLTTNLYIETTLEKQVLDINEKCLLTLAFNIYKDQNIRFNIALNLNVDNI